MPVTVGQPYWQASRSPRYSLLFALPLLITYEILATLLSGPHGGVRNGADVILTSAFTAVAGRYGPLLFGVLAIGTAIWFVARDLRAHGRAMRGGVFALMLGESALLAVLFGLVVGTITARLLGAMHMLALQSGGLSSFGTPTKIMVSLGAGLYEELLFRVILVGALAWAARSLLGMRPLPAGVVATVIGALVFSGFHYVGAYGDVLTLQSFLFRAISGVVFSALYLLRGFGITAWTHALYDVFLVVAGSA